MCCPMLACGGVEMGASLGKEDEPDWCSFDRRLGRVQVEAQVGVAHDVAFHLI